MPSDKIDRLKAQRAGHRGVATKLMKEVQDIISHEDFTRVSRIKSLNSLIVERIGIVTSLDEQIVEVIETADLEQEVVDASEIELRLKDTLDAINEFVKKAEVQTNGGVQTTTTTSNHEVNTGDAAQNINPLIVPTNVTSQGQENPPGAIGVSPHFKAKLPKLNLPKFRGDITSFTSFWDSFQSMIHANTFLSSVDKFNYLKSYLEGEALRSIEGLPLSEANYQAALDILKRRYGNKQQIISAHMDELLKIPSCPDNVRQLKYVYDKINVHVRGLEALGIDSEKYGSLFIPIIMARLPREISLQIARLISQDVWAIDDVLRVIRQEVEARELSENARVKEMKKPDDHERRRNNSPKRGQSTAASLTNQVEYPTWLCCIFCQSKHYSAECKKVTDVATRVKILKEEGRCFVCLKKGHRANNCPRTRNCRNCEKRHHQAICGANQKTKEAVPKDKPSGKPNQEMKHDQQEEVLTTTNVARTKPNVILQTARAFVRGRNESKIIEARVLFDGGSQRSYITNELQEKLGVKRQRTETLHLNTFGGKNYSRQKCDLIELSVGKNGEETMIKALTFPTICSKLSSKIETSSYPHLQGLDLADDFEDPTNSTIDLLIGSDYYWEFITGNVIKGNSGPVAVKSKLGWILSGVVEASESNHSQEVHSTNLIVHKSEVGLPEQCDDPLVGTLEKFWQTESIGICDTNEDAKPEFEIFLDDVQHDGERYNVKLPWKAGVEVLPDHYQLSVNRANYLLRRLKNNKELLAKYDHIIREQLETGVIEVVDPEEASHGKIHYMPHHGVIRENKATTKIRIVYDGSAHEGDDHTSINSCLRQGPNLIPSLFDILLRFRFHQVGLVADIEKAFLMIGIDTADRDSLRFLWFQDVMTEENPKLVEYRFCRLVFGLKPSPAILGATILHHLAQQEQQEAVCVLKNSLYVDDLTTGEDTVTDAFKLYQSSKSIMASGGFNLRKWTSNSEELCNLIERSERGAQITVNTTDRNQNQCVTEDDQSYTKSVVGSFATNSEDLATILGVSWDTRSDMLLYDFEELRKYISTLPVTKRSILKLAARVFDPLGFVTPFVIKVKVLFQELCADKSSWDDELSGEIKQKWNILVNELLVLRDVRIPRCYFTFPSAKRRVELHGFCDASGKAYAAVIYVRSVVNDHVETTLMCSKSRVAPLKLQTIPRLELLGALILARLMSTVQEALSQITSIDAVYCWTDSTATLCWIQNEKSWKQYITHRVDEIHKLTSTKVWRHCPGSKNPADLPSRGMMVQQLIESELWWKGPEFLKQDESQWPAATRERELDQSALNEVVKQPPTVTHVFATSQENNPRLLVSRVINIDSFNSLTKLLRVTATVVRVVNKWKRSLQRTPERNLRGTPADGPLTADEMNFARTQWILSIQEEFYEKEINAVNNDNPNATPYVKQFGLYMDENRVLRCRGRLENSSLAYTTRNPALLPAKHRLSLLIIKDAHHKTKHSGVGSTLTCLRECYWIPRGREAVKRFVKQCIVCCRYAGKSFAVMPPPQLPRERVDEGPPWSNTGVDYAGPLYVKKKDSSNDHATEKVYICLFTCAATRAVHLELVEGCSAEQFLRAFRRFASRRGLPKVVMSDNAKNFKSCRKEIETIRRSPQVRAHMANSGVSWNFIVEKAPWWGGFWERIIRLTKDCLKRSIGKASLTFDEMHTLLIEIEAVLNARPLTYIYDDVEGISYPLSPSQLIYGRRIASTPDEEYSDVKSTNDSLTRRMQHHRRLLTQFTTRWSQEYLTSLLEKAKRISDRTKEEILAVGDIVFMKERGTARCLWRMARIEELLPGRDGKIRAAKIRLMTKETHKPTMLRRPIQLLIPTEVTSRKGN